MGSATEVRSVRLECCNPNLSENHGDHPTPKLHHAVGHHLTRIRFPCFADTCRFAKGRAELARNTSSKPFGAPIADDHPYRSTQNCVELVSEGGISLRRGPSPDRPGLDPPDVSRARCLELRSQVGPGGHRCHEPCHSLRRRPFGCTPQRHRGDHDSLGSGGSVACCAGRSAGRDLHAVPARGRCVVVPAIPSRRRNRIDQPLPVPYRIRSFWPRPAVHEAPLRLGPARLCRAGTPL